MNDPAAAAGRIAVLLDRARRGPLAPEACRQMAEDLPLVPGLVPRVAAAMSQQRDAAAVDTLLVLPAGVPGVIEGLFHALREGVVRRRADGEPFPTLLALDFRRGRAPAFDALLRRAHATFGSSLEVLDVQGRLHYRTMLAPGRGTLAGRAAAVAQDLAYLHDRLARRRGTRLWLNGWCLPAEGKVGPPAQAHLLRAWLAWAAGRTETGR